MVDRTVQTRVVKIVSDASGLKQGVDTANRSLRGLGREAKRTADSVEGMSGQLRSMGRFLAGAGITAGVVAAGRAMANFARETLQWADALERASDITGFAVEDLQELRIISEDLGIAQNTADMALQRFSRRVGEAARGTGVLEKEFKRYNIALRDNEGRMRAVEDILDDYADAVQGANSDQEQLRLSVQAFDIEGAKLVRVLKQGSEGMRELRDEARSAGRVIEEDMVTAAARTEQHWEKATSTMRQNFQRMVLDVLESLDLLSVRTERGITRRMDEIARELEQIESATPADLERSARIGVGRTSGNVRRSQQLRGELIALRGELAQMEMERNESQRLRQAMASRPTEGTEFDAEGAKSVEETTKKTVELVSTFGKLNTEMKLAGETGKTVQEELTAGQETLLAAVRATGSAFADELVDTFTGASAGFKSMIDSMLEDLVRLTTQLLIIEPAVKAITGFLTPSAGPTTSALGGALGAASAAVFGGAAPTRTRGAGATLAAGGFGAGININNFVPGVEVTPQPGADGRGLTFAVERTVENGFATGAFDAAAASSFGLARQGTR